MLLMCLMVFIAACDDDDPPPQNFGTVSGTVSAPGKAVLPGVTVSIGTKSTTTNSNGYFVLSGIQTGSAIRVDFLKVGFVQTQKVIEVQKNQTTYVTATLFNPVISSFSAASGGTLTDSGLQVDLPANAFVDGSGNAFTGTVLSELKYFDPSSSEALEAFPGGFYGTQTDGTETMFESYGFFYGGFYDAANPATKLQLATGKKASVQYPVPFALQASAPATIPLWYYNDATGKWMEEGSATLVGSIYTAEVSHFSYWNFDHPIEITDQSTLTGRVILDEGDVPVANAQVVATGVNYAGYTRVYSDANGLFSITVKASAQVRVQAFAGQNNSPQTAIIDTPAGAGSLAIGDLVVADRTFILTGKLVDSSGNPVYQGYGQLYQVNPPAGEMAFNVWVSCDSLGNFSLTTSSPVASGSFNVQFRFQVRGTLFSNPIAFTIPQPGQVRDFGTVTLRPGGNLSGRVKDNSGNWVANKWISFRQEGASGEGSMMSANTDAQGNFVLEGPPNTSLSSMKASVWIDGTEYSSPAMTLSFPASGSSNSIGTITVSPAK